jgi:hypothetical protein
MKCLAKDRNQNPCRNSATNDRFCRYHDYMVSYTHEMLADIKVCSTCKKMHYLGEYNTCEKCRLRGQDNRKDARETIVKCVKEGCKFKKSDENNYCGKHQCEYYVEETLKSGMVPCSNYKYKNCRNPLPKDYKFKRCNEFREKEREYDHSIRKAASEEPCQIQGMKTCSVCCKDFTIEMFKGNNGETKTCRNCRDAFKIADEKRDKEHVNKLSQENDNKPLNKYNKYKDRCLEKNINFELTIEEFSKFIFDKCYYCGTKDNINNKHNQEGINGIDRMDSTVGYKLNNCVPCCKMCNYMKINHSVEDFLKMIEHIGTYNKLFKGKFYPELFKSYNPSYKQYGTGAKQRCYEFNISENLFEIITNQDCYLCGHNDEKLCNGLDRFDNSIGYTSSNIRSCCKTCNFIKKEYEYEDLMKKIKLIYKKIIENNNTQINIKQENFVIKKEYVEIIQEITNKEFTEEFKEPLPEIILKKELIKEENENNEEIQEYKQETILEKEETYKEHVSNNLNNIDNKKQENIEENDKIKLIEKKKEYERLRKQKQS